MKRPRTSRPRPWRRLPWHRLPWRRLLGPLVAAAFLAAAPATAAPPGELDASFGVSGTLRTNLGGTYDWAYAVAVQPDGKILTAGVSNAGGTHDFALVRYHRDGSLDTGFGSGGTVTTDFGDSYDWAYALVLQPDGGIVLGGVSDASGSRDFALARYRPDGTLDKSFGAGGLVLSRLRPLSVDTIRGLALQRDGRIVAVGTTYEDAVSLRPHGDFMVARYLPDGAADPTFGVNGVTATDFGGESYEEPYAVVIQPDGHIVLGGYSNSGGGREVLFGADDLALARYTPSGFLDPRFGEGGKVTVDLGTLDEEIRALALAPDGRIVAGGYADGEKRGDMVLARFTREGALDPGFGDGGYTRTDLGSRSELLTAVALMPDGRIMAGGQVAPQEHGDFAVLRYHAGGALDPAFGSGGVVRIDFGAREDRVQGIALQRDAKVVAGGYSEADFAVARLNVGGG